MTSLDKISSMSPNKRTPTHQVKKQSTSKVSSKSRKDEPAKASSNMLSIQLLKPPIKNNMQSLFQPNSKGRIEMLECSTPSSCSNAKEFTVKDTSYDRSQVLSNNRSSTQERVLKMADESLRQINNHIESSQRTSQSSNSEAHPPQATVAVASHPLKVKKNNFLKQEVTPKNGNQTNSLKSGI